MSAPLERGFTTASNPTDFKGWVLGFYDEWLEERTKLPTMLADAQSARWRSKYGRDPAASVAIEQGTNGYCMRGIQLNAQVLRLHLQNMHEK